MLLTENHSRSVVANALWKALTYSHSKAPKDPPEQFMRRLRKMTELGVPIPHEQRRGTGNRVAYSAEQAFELGLALQLQTRAGLNQSEVAYMITNVRDEIAEAIGYIRQNPPAGRNAIGASDRPHAPTRLFFEKHSSPADQIFNSGSSHADTSVFMMFRQFDMPEITAVHGKPVITVPKVFQGLAAFAAELNELCFYLNDGVHTLVELSGFAWLLDDELSKAV